MREHKFKMRNVKNVKKLKFIMRKRKTIMKRFKLNMYNLKIQNHNERT